MSLLLKCISALLSLIFIPLSGLTYGIDLISVGNRNEIERTNIAGIGAYFRSQGITCDGDFLYFSSKTTLIKTEKDAVSAVNVNLSAIPDELNDNYGIKHIGGLSYYNGKIFAGMEDSKVWKYPIIGVFDSETLELVDYYIMDSDIITRGMPWVCVNPENGYLYCMDHSKNPTKILIYDVNNNMNFVDSVVLEESIYSIQGAEFFDGILYAATNDDTQAIYRIDVNSGSVSKYIDRNLTSGSEGEGMTFIVSDGKPQIIAMDMGPIFVNAFVRWYDLA